MIVPTIPATWLSLLGTHYFSSTYSVFVCNMLESFRHKCTELRLAKGDSPLETPFGAQREKPLVMKDRKAYFKQYHEEYKKRTKRKNIVFSLEHFAVIEAEAKAHNMPTSTFIRSAVMAYISDKRLIPNEAIFRSVEMGIQKIGSNINQIVKYIHQNKYLSIHDIKDLKSYLIRMEHFIRNQVEAPKSLWEELDEQIKNDHQFLGQLQAFIDQYV